jgi:hypothetical protein
VADCRPIKCASAPPFSAAQPPSVDLVLDARLEEREQEPELRLEPDLVLAHVELAVQAGPLEAQHVPLPGVVELEILLEPRGDLLRGLARLLEGEPVAAAHADLAHFAPLAMSCSTRGAHPARRGPILVQHRGPVLEFRSIAQGGLNADHRAV